MASTKASRKADNKHQTNVVQSETLDLGHIQEAAELCSLPFLRQAATKTLEIVQIAAEVKEKQEDLQQITEDSTETIVAAWDAYRDPSNKEEWLQPEELCAAMLDLETALNSISKFIQKRVSKIKERRESLQASISKSEESRRINEALAQEKKLHAEASVNHQEAEDDSDSEDDSDAEIQRQLAQEKARTAAKKKANSVPLTSNNPFDAMRENFARLGLPADPSTGVHYPQSPYAAHHSLQFGSPMFGGHPDSPAMGYPMAGQYGHPAVSNYNSGNVSNSSISNVGNDYSRNRTNPKNVYNGNVGHVGDIHGNRGEISGFNVGAEHAPRKSKTGW